MKLKSIKQPSETDIIGIQFVKVDNAITEVIIGKLHIRKGESYNNTLQVLIEAPYETESRYRLTGKIAGFPDAVSYHDSGYDADIAGAKLKDAGASFTVDCIDVLIDDAGNIVGPANPCDAVIGSNTVEHGIPF